MPHRSLPRSAGASLVPVAAVVLALLASSLPPLVATAGAQPTELWLQDGRFRVTADWATGHGTAGPGFAVPFTDESGTFWFFRQDNVEVTVKVLDACVPPFDRFWVFAAGMTDVDVVLTVEDTWADRSEVYRNVLETPFEPVLDTASFDTCAALRPCGMGTAGEVRATPRSDHRAERAAVAIGGGLTAGEDDYQRAAADLGAVSAAHPELADVEYHTPETPDELIVGFDPATHDLIEAGTYTGWDCLNAWYGAAGEPWIDFPEIGYAIVTFAGIFDLDRVGEDYLELPGALFVGRNGVIPAPLLPPPPALCATRAGDTFRYYFDWIGGVPNRWFFTSEPGQPPVLVGSYVASDGGPVPDWADDLEACFGVV